MNNTENMSSQRQTFIEQLRQQGLILPYSEDRQVYQKPLSLYGKKIDNRIGILPLEGFDSTIGGGPTELVQRRYLRFVKGGAGLIWFEACAVSDDGKSNPRQMALTDENVKEFQKLIQLMDATAMECGRKPAFKVLQLTHSGKVSRDQNWNPIPLSAYLASDERIREMVKEHIQAAKLAADAGFDAVDIKVCHGYFLNELLSAFHRPEPYGGSFENRTRALFEIVDGIKEAIGDQIGIAVRLNAFDSEPYPYGYGLVKEDGSIKADLQETVRICQMLQERGVELINISASSPEKRVFGPDPSDRKYQRYASSTDLLTAVKLLKEQVPEMTFMCSGLSAFQEFGAEIGAGGIQDGWFDIAGFGRQALAYPDFARNILEHGHMDRKKCCIGCNYCFKLMDPGHTMVGCVVRDKELYKKID